MGKSFNTGTLVNGLSTDANGNVAIGIASPTTRLTIGRVDSTNEGGQIDLCRASDNTNAWGIDVFGNTTTPSLRFVDNVASAARMVITGAGNVGIGTTSPTGTYGRLSVAGGISIFDDNNAKLEIGRYSSGAANSYIKIGTNSNSLRITNAADSADLVTFANSGNVGIGTSNPTTPLYVVGPMKSESGLYFNNTGTNGAFVWQEANTPLRFATNDTERMRIMSNGDVVVGTTTSPYVGTNRGNIFLNGVSQSLYGFGIAGAARGYMYHAGTQLYFENSASGGNLYMTATSGGVVLNSSATSWSSNSDERLKNIIGNIENAVDSLLTLRTVKHTWKSDESNKECLALIAQDVEKVFPQIVDKYTLPVKPDDTNPDETEYLGVRYTELIPVLVKAIKELKEEIDILKNK
jgi:hypothetical protein